MPDGRLVRTGDYLKRPKLARTLERIANDPDIYYNGTMAQEIEDDIAEYSKLYVYYTPM